MRHSFCGKKWRQSTGKIEIDFADFFPQPAFQL